MRAARGECLLRQLVHLRPTVARNREQPLSMCRRIAELARREGLEERLHEQHHERFIADDHARGIVVRELLVELEAEGGKERHRLLQVLDGEVDEDLAWFGHEVLYAVTGATSPVKTRPMVMLLMPASFESRFEGIDGRTPRKSSARSDRGQSGVRLQLGRQAEQGE